VAARTARELDALAREVDAAGGRALAVPADVTDAAAVEALVAAAGDAFGAPTLLVNNAGAWRHVGPLAEADPEAWWGDVEVTLRGAFLCTRAVLPAMLAAGAGRIVNVASYAAIRPQPYATGYASGKAALLRLTDSLAAELAGTGVVCLAVTPGFVRTDLVEALAGSPAGRAYLPALAERQDALPPERVAELVVEVASGRLDALAGRFVHVLDDTARLAADADAIVADDLYALRLRLPG
jgi:NAD(P)-dependent dehydrogenase (short-subunit alcohol dehydrogenase family)